MTMKCIMCTAPSDLCDYLKLYTPSRTLRSASDTLSLQIPRTRPSAVGSRVYFVFGPSTWKDLPRPLGGRGGGEQPLWAPSNPI